MIALAAAYLVVLQTLLLPLSVAAGSPFLGVLCTSSVSQPAGQPAKPGMACPCAAGCGMQCCAEALAAPAPALAERLPANAYIISAPLSPVAVVLTPTRSPSIPRAPPAT